MLQQAQEKQCGPGEDAEERGSLRRCLVTGKRLPPEQLLRFVVSPDGEIVADFAARLPGRGLWLTAEGSIVRTALAKKLFAKAARQQVTVAPDLPEHLVRTARKRFLSDLGLAKRAGALVSGYEAVRAAVANHQVKLLIGAADGAEQAQQRLHTAAGRGVVCIGSFLAADLGQALGRDIAVHLAVTEQRWADRLSQRAALALALEQGSAA